MGDFKSGMWIIGLSVYFFVFFLIVYSLTNGANQMGLSHSVTYNDPGFLSSDPLNTSTGINATINSQGSSDVNGFIDTVSVMAGFNANIGIPNTIRFIFSFFAFWIPGAMLIWAIYRSLPFV